MVDTGTDTNKTSLCVIQTVASTSRPRTQESGMGQEKYWEGGEYSPTVNQTTTRSPVELELTGRVGNSIAVQIQGASSSIRGSKLDKAVAGITVHV